MSAKQLKRRAFDWSQVRVIALFLCALAILALGVWQVGKVFDVFADRYPLVAPAVSVAGLQQGAAVTLAGQRVGQVDDITFIPIAEKRDSNNVVIHLSVNQGVQSQIRADSRAHIRTEGLLGNKYVDIEPGTPGRPVLDRGDTVTIAPTVDLDAVLATAAATMDTAQLVMNKLSAVVEPLAAGEGTLGRLLYDERLYERLVGTTDQLALLLGRVNRGQGTLGRLATDEGLYDQLSGAVTRFDVATVELLEGEGSLARMLRSDSLYLSVSRTTASADSALARLAATLEGINQGEGTLGRLVVDPALYEALLKAVVDVQTVIEAIRQDPSLIRPDVRVDVF